MHRDIDTILNHEKIPLITDVVDCDKYKYVWSGSSQIRCGDWLIDMPVGFLSDGASGVPDRLPEAWFAHDRLYLSPHACYRNVYKRLSRKQCDMIYARLGLLRRNWVVFFEGLALAAGLGRRAWNKYRALDDDCAIQERILPHASCWDLPTHYTRDARWVGPR